MHKLVALDAADRVLRPAIRWNDKRTAAECREIEAAIGVARLIELTGIARCRASPPELAIHGGVAAGVLPGAPPPSAARPRQRVDGQIVVTTARPAPRGRRRARFAGGRGELL
jgi:hypothetical protein